MALPEWNSAAFGCLIRDSNEIRSLMRTQISASLPAPLLSRSADSSAPLAMRFTLEMNEGQFRAWLQWFTYDLFEGSLPFLMSLPWGTQQPQVRCRLIDQWRAQRFNVTLWELTAGLEIERESLPRFSGGAL